MILKYSSKQLVSVEGVRQSLGATVGEHVEDVLIQFGHIENPDWSTLRVRIELDEVSKAFNHPDALLISAYITSRGDGE